MLRQPLDTLCRMPHTLRNEARALVLPRQGGRLLLGRGAGLVLERLKLRRSSAGDEERDAQQEPITSADTANGTSAAVTKSSEPTPEPGPPAPHSDFASLPDFSPRRLGATAVLPCEIWGGDVRDRLPDDKAPLASEPPLRQLGTQESLDSLRAIRKLIKKNTRIEW